MSKEIFVDYGEYNLQRLGELISLAAGKYRSEAYARLLADRYGSFENILAAPADELRRIVGEEVASLLKLTAMLLSQKAIESFTLGVDHTTVEIADYLKKRFLGESVEIVLALPLDSAGRILECREVARGTINSSSIFTRDLAEAAINAGSKRLAIAHNHPLGMAKVSNEDATMTGGLAEQLMRVGITLECHYIIAGMECEIVNSEFADN